MAEGVFDEKSLVFRLRRRTGFIRLLGRMKRKADLWRFHTSLDKVKLQALVFVKAHVFGLFDEDGVLADVFGVVADAL